MSELTKVQEVINTGKFFELTIIGKGVGKGTVSCQCSCGVIKDIRAVSILAGDNKTCGEGCRKLRSVNNKIRDGYKCGWLTLTGVDHEKTTEKVMYAKYKCDCGNVVSKRYGTEKAMKFASCGCYRKQLPKPTPPSVLRVLEKKVFGRYTVVRHITDRYVECICSCGEVREVRADSLESGDSKSCGCLTAEVNSKRLKGKFKPNAIIRHPLYQMYHSMLSRCRDSKRKDFKWYGGRGISVCDRWKEPNTQGFLNFAEDMDSTYEKGLEIERVDVNGNYEKSNCMWITRTSQLNNTTQNRILSGYGIKLSVSEWAYLLDISSKLIDDRINHCKREGSMEEILAVMFRDRQHSLLYKGEVLTASKIFELEGYTLGQRNGRISKHGGSVEALKALGVDFTVTKERSKSCRSFEEAITWLNNNFTHFDNHLKYKIEKQGVEL